MMGRGKWSTKDYGIPARWFKLRREKEEGCFTAGPKGNQSIGQYLSVQKDSFSHPPTNRRLEEAVVDDWPKMMEFKAL
ncbi:hypothetical protein AVEN_169249-1 [Araneus ventricosus]|uniref:Uncharacterized protein n=1 Tax=Araneus ventricosus TaxID=182803 RepID=A0A4Y2WAT9_ARAVE|nr:hypothetical protein AVEN_169249-1 [Araneus ventricosus]